MRHASRSAASRSARRRPDERADAAVHGPRRRVAERDSPESAGRFATATACVRAGRGRDGVEQLVSANLLDLLDEAVRHLARAVEVLESAQKLARDDDIKRALRLGSVDAGAGARRVTAVVKFITASRRAR